MSHQTKKEMNQVNEDSVFMLRIQFRRNTSWQGTLQSMNSRKSCIFRSVLELGSLMHEERSSQMGFNDKEADATPSWNNKEEVS